MSASYVRRYYGVTYKRGDRVTVDGKAGTIVSFPDQYLGVRFDGVRGVARCHPKWRVELGEPEPFGLVDLLARRPELRDVGIAGYLAGDVLGNVPGMPLGRRVAYWSLTSVSVREWAA